MPTRTSRWIVAAGAGVPLFFSACSSANATAADFDEAAIPEEDRYGGTIVIVEAVDLADLNPLTVGTLVSYQVIASIAVHIACDGE